jgi:hypothetical protein
MGYIQLVKEVTSELKHAEMLDAAGKIVDS